MLRSSLHKRVQPQSAQAASANSSNISPTKSTRSVTWDPAIIDKSEDSKKPAKIPRSAVTISSVTVATVSFSKPCEAPPCRGNPRPALHPLFDPETSAKFDARLHPFTMYPADGLTEPATASRARYLRIVSREFPWTLDVSNRDGSIVTCADVFDTLYAGLSVQLTDSEWTLADDAKKDSMMRANRIRRGGHVPVRRLRRIDWLGSKIYFKGLYKDDTLIRSRLLPEEALWPETWVVKFESC